MTTKRADRFYAQSQAIKTRLRQRGYPLSAVDYRFKLPTGSAGDALRNPNQRGEKAIAAALDVHPKSLWPSRYDGTTGQRLTPQPSVNYVRQPTILQRRKLMGAQT